jgi:hypothetical protein
MNDPECCIGGLKMENDRHGHSRIGIGAVIGGLDAQTFSRIHSRLVTLFKVLDGFQFSSAINLYGIYFYVDGAACAFPIKPGVHGLRFQKKAGVISVKIHLTEQEWREKTATEAKHLVASQFEAAFSIIASRLSGEDISFDLESFLLATGSVLSEFLNSDLEIQASAGETEIHKRLRDYLEMRDSSAQAAQPVPELQLRNGFRMERDPLDASRVRIRQA